MQIGEKIKNYRKTAGLTQEQVANYLGVSTPAVNKWEKGNTYPDISLLPALARLLKIDMNELFSFHEELTEKEIGQFVNELSEVSLDSFTEAFEMASRKIQYRNLRNAAGGGRKKKKNPCFMNRIFRRSFRHLFQGKKKNIVELQEERPITV